MLPFCSQGAEVNYYEQMCLDWTRIYTPWNSAWTKATQYCWYIYISWWLLKGIHCSPSQSVHLHTRGLDLPIANHFSDISLQKNPLYTLLHCLTPVVPVICWLCCWSVRLIKPGLWVSSSSAEINFIQHHIKTFSLFWSMWSDKKEYVDLLAQT